MRRHVNMVIRKMTRLLIGHPFIAMAFFLAVTAMSLLYALKLTLVSDFETMLPSQFQSVKDLEKYKKRIGGLEYLSVGFESRDVEALKRLVEDLAPRLKERLKANVGDVDYQVKDVQKFYDDFGLLYVPEKDLLGAHDDLKQYLARRKLEATGLYTEVDDEEKDAGESAEVLGRLDDWIEQSEITYKEKYYQPHGYYLTIKPKGRSVIAVMVRPMGFSTNVSGNKLFIEKVRRVIDSMHPRSYAPDMTYGFAGPVQIAIDEYEAIKDDILSTALLCFALIALSILLYFLRLRMVFLLGINLLVGMVWTMGITYGVIGYLNTQTGFLASIIMGTSINYSIIWLARYLEERRHSPAEQSIETAGLKTWEATLGASATTAAGFATLMLSRNNSFVQFGFIASVGVMLNWAAHLTFMPVLALLIEKVAPVRFRRVDGLTYGRITGWLAVHVLKVQAAVVLLAILLAGLSAWKIVGFLPCSLETDLNNLRNKMTFTSGSARMDEKISGTVKDYSTATAAILTDSEDEAAALCKVVEEKAKRNPDRYGYGKCRTIRSLFPEGQGGKLAVIAATRELLERNWALIPDEYRQQAGRLKKLLLVDRAVTEQDFPDQLMKIFKEKDGTIGKIAYVNPVPGKDIWIYKNLQRFVETIKENRLPGGKVITSSGGPVIMYDLLNLVIYDAPRDTAYAILAVFFLIWLILKDFKSSLVIIIALLTGVTMMGGIIALIGVKINFFNFIAVPTAFGTGADYGINILHRYRLERDGGMPMLEALRLAMGSTGGAVFLCSLTTIIGYAVLIQSSSQALASYGWIAIVAELTTLGTAVIFIPSVVAVLKGRM